MTQIPLFIRLKTTAPLSKGDAMAWYRGVRDTLTSGLLASVQTTDPQGDPDVIAMVHKELNSGEHYYEIPLARDLTSDEIESIEELFPDSTIETSTPTIPLAGHRPADAVVMDEDQYNQLCETLAKHQHQRWYDERASRGWSFGLLFDENNKKHPLMRSWEQLPPRYRKIDYDLPHLFMNMLVDQGYVVVSRDQLIRWVKGKE